MNLKLMKLVHDNDFSELINSIIQERFQQYQDRIDSLQQAYLSKSNKLYKLEKELSDLKVSASQEDVSLDFINSILPLYRSPSDEQSDYKGIPIKYLKSFQKHFKGVYKMRYRGNNAKDQGYKRPKSHVRVEYATTFAMYPIHKGV